MEVDAAYTVEREAPPKMDPNDSLPSIVGDLHDYLQRFVSYPSEHGHIAHTLWCVHAHLMDHWDTTPRLGFFSAEKESGKTRALEMTENVVPRPILTINVSPAYLMRKVADEEGAPTILYDEIDTVFGEKAGEHEDLRGLLNAGYRRGAVSGRCVMHGKTVLTVDIPAYSAVALAGIGRIPDTILSRTIVVQMKRRTAGQKVEPYRPRIHAARGHQIRDRLIAWAATVERIEWPALPPSIQDRAADIWEPLVAIADMAGDQWPRVAREAAVALTAKSREVELSVGVQLLADLKRIFLGRDRMHTQDILKELKEMEDAPWNEIERGNPISAWGLAKRLKEYDIKPDDIRMGDVRKGYHKQDFADAWARYLPKESATDETPLQPEIRSASDALKDEFDAADFV